MKKIQLHKITYPLLALLLIATTLWSASITGAYATSDGTAGTTPVCGIVEHTHGDGCSTTRQSLICGLEEDTTHIHEGTCYEYENKLVCTQAVVEAHTHGDACYSAEQTVSCDKEETAGHAHGDGCYETVTSQTCGKEAHVHDASCQTETKSLICTQTEVEAHTHGDACYIEEESLTCTTAETAGHKHGDDCYEFSLTCTNTEEGHIHDTTCYIKTDTLICGQTEHDAHTHGDGCYTKTTTLNCAVAETTGHTHGDSCYETVTSQTCDKEVHEHDTSCQTTEKKLICQQIEVAAHSHDTRCYTENKILTCGKEETTGHTHGEDCYQLQVTTLLCTIHIHSEDCYTAETQLTCALAEHTHSEDCYESAAELCEYCGVELVENAVHVKGCLTYCNCNFVVGGGHTENCLIHCTCDQKKGVHQSGCVLYKETTIESSYGVTVFGALPETAELVVQPLLETDLTDFTLAANEFLAFAYDISIVVDGTEYQPNGTVEVTVPAEVEIPDDRFDWKLVVQHVDNGLAESVTCRDNGDGTVTFWASGFSIYVGTLVQEATVILTSGGGYQFYSDVACSSIVTGSYELDEAASTQSIYVKADSNYTISAITVTNLDGSSSVASISGPADGVYTVTIPTTVDQSQIINVDVFYNGSEAIDVNFALLEWKSKGCVGSITIELDDTSIVVSDQTSYDTAYALAYAKMLVNATETFDNGDSISGKTISQDSIWIINDTVSLSGNLTISTGGRLVILCDNSDSMKLVFGLSSRVNVNGGAFSVQGKSDSSRLVLDGGGAFTWSSNTVTKIRTKRSAENMILLNAGNMYLTYTDLTNSVSLNSSTSTKSGAIYVSTSSGANAYVSDFRAYECLARSAGVLYAAKATASSVFYFYNCDFSRCVAYGGINNSGGSVIRGGGSGNYIFEQCKFHDNLAMKGNSGSKGHDGGGAVRWSVGSSTKTSGWFNNCSFYENTAIGQGGAILASGGLELNACEIYNNTATESGGGVFAVVHSQVTQGDGNDKSGSVTFGPGTEIYQNTVTGSGGLGGGIHFYVGSSYEGTSLVENYDFFANINGASLHDNSADNGGGVAMTVSYNYECGVYVYSGSSVYNNSAINGGAVYIESDAVYENNNGFHIEGGTVSNNKADEKGGAVYIISGNATVDGGTIRDNLANDGGGIYVAGGELSISGGMITENTALYGGGSYVSSGALYVSDGEIINNTALSNGGGAYLGGGDMIVSGGSISGNEATGSYTPSDEVTGNGGGAFVSGGELIISGGSISYNTALDNGGGACVENGTVIMSGGTVDNNTATNGAGGGMYVSASDYNASVTIYSGSITNNSAGTSGGAVAVVGTTGGDETITITVTLGVNEDHSTLPFNHPDTKTGPYQHKSCPVIEKNSSSTSGGAIYITGGDETHLNIYCLLEKNNQVGDGDSLSNCMMVEGGTVNISSSDPNTGLGSDHGNTEINGTVHVLGGSVLLGGNTGGDVTLSGATSNPKFNSAITVDVTEAGGSFIDNRVSDTYYKLLYFENFLALAASTPTGQYTAYQFPKEEPLTISGSIYSHPGYTILGWCTTDTIGGNGKWYDVGSTYPSTEEIEEAEKNNEDPYKDLTLYAIWKMNGYTVKFYPNVPSGEAYTGTMEPQQFTYNVEEPLASNVFEYPGYIFTGWLASNGNTYADGANILNLTTKDGAVIDFYATWAKCLHDGTQGTHLVYTADGNTLTRECTCGGQTLYATLTAEDTVYDRKGHPVQVVYSDENWMPAVVYTKDGAKFSGTPINAGTYTAAVTDSGKTASVTYTIAKADQDPPDVPTFTVSGDKLTVDPVAESSKANIDDQIVTYYQLFYYVGGTEYSSAASTDTVFAFDVSYTSYYVKVWYSEGVNHKASEKVRSTQTYFFNEGDTQIRFVVGTGILCSVVENPNQNVGGLVITVDPDEGYYLTSDFSVTKTNNKGDTSEIITEDVHKTYLLRRIPNVEELEIVVTIDGAAKQATPQATVTEKQVFGNVTGTSATISQDSAFTAYYSVSNYDTTAYSGLKLDFSPAAPAGTTIILLNKSDGSYWSYTVPSGGASSVALTNFTRMGSTETFSISGTNLSYQFIVDFSRASGEYISGTLSMTLSGDKTDANVPVLTASVTVKLVAQSSFTIEKQSTDDGLTQTFKLNYTASDGVASRWDNRKTSLVLTPDAPLPADASLLVTLENGQKIDWSMSGNGSYIIPLSAVGNEKVTVELVSSLFPTEGATYIFKAQWMVSNSAAARAPMNGYAGASMETTVDFTKAETAQHAMKVTGSSRLLPISSIEPLKVTVTYQLPTGAVGYTVTAELLRKGDDSEYISTAWNRTITSSGHVLEVSLTGLGLPPGSYCLMLTMAADSGASTILQVPYYFIAE